MDEATKAFFRKQQQEDENQVCIDLGSIDPQWASVSHGCYISLEASGVHRSLGVHVSFVRSITMDAWKPQQLKLMELGGNARLRAFFHKHSVPDDMPIAQKYATRAAEWYRRNLRAEADGTEPPPPLEEGTGHLPASDAAPSATQLAFAKAAAAAVASPGGALSSSARHYAAGGVWPASSPAGPTPSASATPSSAGAAQPSPSSSSTSPPAKNVRLEGFGGGGGSTRGRSPTLRGTSESEDGTFLSGLLGQQRGAKVSAGVWSTVGFVGTFANRAKERVEQKLQQAKEEGWIDTALEGAKQKAGDAVEASKTTYSNIAEGRTREVLANTTKAVGSSMDWVAEQLVSLGSQDSSTGLQQMSSGTMQGFGPDSLPQPSMESPPSASSTAAPQAPRRRTACCEEDEDAQDGDCLRSGGQRVTQLPSTRTAAVSAAAAATAKAPPADPGAQVEEEQDEDEDKAAIAGAGGGAAGAGAANDGAASSSPFAPPERMPAASVAAAAGKKPAVAAEPSHLAEKKLVEPESDDAFSTFT